MNLLLLEEPFTDDLFENNNFFINPLTHVSDVGLNSISAIFTKLKYELSADFLCKYVNLKYVIVPTTGLNHIDLEYCQKNKIKVISLKDSNVGIERIQSTLEIAIWHLIDLVRHASNYNQSVWNGRWDRLEFPSLSLSSYKLGVIGYGRLGSKMAKFGLSLGMQVFVYDINENLQIAENDITRVAGIHDLFSHVDIVSVHVDDRIRNKNLIDRNVLSFIPQGKSIILINTSRGFVLDDHEIVRNVENGKIDGLGVDVLIDETASEYEWLKNNEIWKLFVRGQHNIRITPHIGGSTLDAQKYTEKLVAKLFFETIARGSE